MFARVACVLVGSLLAPRFALGELVSGISSAPSVATGDASVSDPTSASPSAVSATGSETESTGAAESLAAEPKALLPALAPRAPMPAPSPVPARVVISPGEALVHVAVSHRDAWLEMRSYVDGGEFVRVCRAPCDVQLQVDGREARVSAAGMTTSNIFRFDAGSGVAGVRVDGGSAAARSAGVISLAAGIPVALIGMALFAQGRMKDNSGLEIAGIAGLSAGGLSISVSLPLLLLGTTHVKNAKGSLIALAVPQRGTAL